MKNSREGIRTSHNDLQNGPTRVTGVCEWYGERIRSRIRGEEDHIIVEIGPTKNSKEVR